MKKAFSTLLFLFISLNFFAQASFTATGIAVQGIARDANNSAYQNQNITLEFEFYFYDESNAEKIVGSRISKQIVTDNFGVFSTIIDPNFANNSVFSNEKVWLRIINKEDSRTIQESQLMHVPYAISANNGVPTGSIMPFIGKKDDVPEGWLLCDGESIANNANTAKLIGLLGEAKTPNLQGMFLRGTGKATVNQGEGPSLMSFQGDDIRKHKHSVGSLTIGNVGSKHNHSYKDYYWSDTGLDDDYGVPGGDAVGERLEVVRSISNSGEHTHNLTGNTGETGITETRPVNFGVNYIIKL